jgi:hypothetical protein
MWLQREDEHVSSCKRNDSEDAVEREMKLKQEKGGYIRYVVVGTCQQSHCGPTLLVSRCSVFIVHSVC